MNVFDVDGMQPDVFGQMAEQIMADKGGYDEGICQYVMDKIDTIVEAGGKVVGRTIIIEAVRDGEVGGVQRVMRHRPGVNVHDPVAQGV